MTPNFIDITIPALVGKDGDEKGISSSLLLKAF